MVNPKLKKSCKIPTRTFEISKEQALKFVNVETGSFDQSENLNKELCKFAETKLLQPVKLHNKYISAYTATVLFRHKGKCVKLFKFTFKWKTLTIKPKVKAHITENDENCIW